MQGIDRRHFLITAGTLASASHLLTAAEPQKKNPVCVFTKPFQSLNYESLAQRVSELGFDGIEAPIREGGHIEPEQVPDELPKLVESLRRHGLEITVMASSINDPNDPLTEAVLRTAAGLGIKRYRMKYFNYDDDRPIKAQLADWRSHRLDSTVRPDSYCK